MNDDNIEYEWRWCLVGNIVEKHEYGEEHEIRIGTKQFSPGTKVYLAPAQWGDGYEQVVMIGKPRKSLKLIEVISKSDYVVNFRVQKVFKPMILKMMGNSKYRWWGNSEEDHDLARSFCDSLNKRMN